MTNSNKQKVAKIIKMLTNNHKHNHNNHNNNKVNLCSSLPRHQKRKHSWSQRQRVEHEWNQSVVRWQHLIAATRCYHGNKAVCYNGLHKSLSQSQAKVMITISKMTSLQKLHHHTFVEGKLFWPR